MNDLKKIKEIFAFVSDDEGRGESIVGMTMMINDRETLMPFVCADKARMESLKPLAKKISKDTNKTIRLINLSNRKLLETINP